MKQKHTTRKQRQTLRRLIASRIQELEQRQLPRRAALALLKRQEART